MSPGRVLGVVGRTGNLYRSAKKTAVAVAGAGVSFGVLVLMSDPGRVQPEEWAALLIGLGSAFGVYKVTNEPA